MIITTGLSLTGANVWSEPAYGQGEAAALETLNVSSKSRGNTRYTSFSAAKKAAADVYRNKNETFYCGCLYEKTSLIEKGCSYVSPKNSKRSKKIEWEHVVPAHAFGQSFGEWRDGSAACSDRRGKSFKGRKCAAKASQEFRSMEADLYNLVPAIGEVNQLRSNFSMAMIEGEARLFGACDLEIKDRKIEPRPEIRGDIARIYFYMDWAYPGRGVISKKNSKLFEAWDKEDPVDERERERAKKIETLQGNHNPFIK